MPDSEKITINMNAVDLGKVDLLVQEGIYANRTDFIRTAIRSQLEKHSFEIQQSVTRHSSVIGVLAYDRKDFEKRKAENVKLTMTVVGYLNLDSDIPVDLALDVIESIKVHGVFDASPEVKSALEAAKKLK